MEFSIIKLLLAWRRFLFSHFSSSLQSPHRIVVSDKSESKTNAPHSFSFKAVPHIASTANATYASLAMIKPPMEAVSQTDSKVRIFAVPKEGSMVSAKNVRQVFTLKITDVRETPLSDVSPSLVQDVRLAAMATLWTTINASESSKAVNSTLHLEYALSAPQI